MSVVQRRAQRSFGRRPLGLAAVLVAVTVAVLAGCGSDGGSGSGAAPTTVAPTTTTPVDYRSAMVARLSDEWDDPAVAEQVVVAIGPDGLAAWEKKVPMAEVATTPLLAYRTPTRPAGDIDSLVVFAFGNRVAADGTLEPGPVNQALADTTAAFVADHPVPVFAQWEVARLLDAAGVKGVTSIEPTTGPDGQVVYLSTRGVADAIVTEAGATGTQLGTAGVVCFADHEGRCLLNAAAAGIAGTAVQGVELPSTYDPQSGQAWTRDRVSYLVTDLGGRLLL